MTVFLVITDLCYRKHRHAGLDVASSCATGNTVMPDLIRHLLLSHEILKRVQDESYSGNAYNQMVVCRHAGLDPGSSSVSWILNQVQDDSV